NRPIFMFIHGGGFLGGTKTKPEIVSMANYYASRGWVFASIDYRTTAKLGTIEGKSPEDISMFYKGIAPQEWIDFTLQNASSSDEIQTSIAMYAAQRDAKAALRWILANSTTYGVDTDFITVGGASAGAISAIALGISNQENFRDEISTDEDVTLSTTNLNESYTVKSMVYFWGSNIKLELLEAIYGINPYDSSDPELFMAHGTMDANPTTTFSEATELDVIYDSTGVYSQLIPLEGKGHGAWATLVNGKSLSDLSFDFIVERQGLNVE
ncbi:MAG: prolyl oligopeptidase family serine peptidase, partial [Bacteroidota bacterium]